MAQNLTQTQTQSEVAAKKADATVAAVSASVKNVAIKITVASSSAG